MKTIKYCIGLLITLVAMAGCEKEQYDDISLAGTDKDPAKLSAMYNITQDNSGLVTITPNGEGLAYTLVYFGDATTTPEKILPGKATQHKYAEGNYTVKIVGVSVTGKTTEATQPLTVSFRAPENVQMTASIDASNKFQVNVTAKADYETLFRVYFGDVPNEVPQSFLEGATISHVYAKTGTYKVRVVALSGGAASTEVSTDVNIVNPVLLPVNFEDPTQPYPFVNFGGGVSTVVDNPSKSGLNISAKTAKKVKNPGETWGGSLLALGNPIDFSKGKYFMMKVHSPRVGAKVLLKVENPTDGSIFFEKEVLTTVANAWQDLVFDYTAINTANTYQNLVIIFDNGTAGDGTSNFTFYYDDILQVTAPPASTPSLPLDFESSTIVYKFNDFDGGNATVIDNPNKSGVNTSAKVGRMIKNNGQPWGGSWIGLDKAIDFSENKVFRMKVHSPRVGAKVLLKVENKSDGTIAYEKEVLTTVANAWEDLAFDYSGINTANQYHNIVLIFDNGTKGDGSANFTFYFDDIRLTKSLPSTAVELPLNFESSTVTYTFTNFDGGEATVIDNPQKNGINTSNKVGRMIKNNGQPWGGSWIGLDAPIDFSTKKTFTVKVYSPRVGAKLLLKVENQTDGGIAYEKEVSTTKAGEWETLTFDYSGIDATKSYQKIVLIFDNGTKGDGSANFTYYFDDITLN